MELDIQKILSEIERDVSLDELNLKEAQFKLPAIKHKYAGLLIRSKIQLGEKRKELEEHRKQVIEQIKEKSPVKLAPNTLFDTASELPAIKKIKTDIEQIELLITLLEKTEKTLSSMTYDIKNIIDIQKLETT
jgi:hypothetical protein